MTVAKARRGFLATIIIVYYLLTLGPTRRVHVRHVRRRRRPALKYGKYLPHQRANVDQVPLPFVNDMESTYEQVGEKPTIAGYCF